MKENYGKLVTRTENEKMLIVSVQPVRGQLDVELILGKYGK
jgi:hypothetical protein